MFYEIRFSLKFCNIHRGTPVLESLFNKVYLKETSTQVFCEYGVTSKAPVLKNIRERLFLMGGTDILPVRF